MSLLVVERNANDDDDDATEFETDGVTHAGFSQRRGSATSIPFRPAPPHQEHGYLECQCAHSTPHGRAVMRVPTPNSIRASVCQQKTPQSNTPSKQQHIANACHLLPTLVCASAKCVCDMPVIGDTFCAQHAPTFRRTTCADLRPLNNTATTLTRRHNCVYAIGLDIVDPIQELR